jgi:SynChlorMet cassette protein ScmC
MNFSDPLIPDPEALLCSDFGEPPLLFQPLFGEVVALSPVALAIWQAVDGQRSVAEIAAQLQAQCEDAPPDIASDVIVFLNDLKRRGFVSIEPSSSQPNQPEEMPILTRTAFDPIKPHGAATLSLADGSHWQLIAVDESAGRVLAQFAASCGLTQATQPGPQILYLVTDSAALAERVPDDSVFILQAPGALPPVRPVKEGRNREGGQIPPKPPSEQEWLWMQLVRLSAFFGEQVQSRGGFLIHSALAQVPISGAGVLLGGRSGVGKSTASRRLAPPWRSLCDDATLIVRAANGNYWAHPWPTWSRVYAQQYADRWDVQTPVPLQAAFILEQGPVDRVHPAAPAEAVTLLMELSRQASRHLWTANGHKTGLDRIRASNRQRFDNVCALVAARPVFLLDATLEGSFWVEIERALPL